MRRLSEIYNDYKKEQWHGDKGTAHTYIHIYETLLSPYRENCTFLEVGVYAGLSMKMWAEYFINSKIYGCDVTDEFLETGIQDDSRFNISIHDATKPDLPNVLGGHTFDVIIDDGSHKLEDQIKTFLILKKWMNPGGIYIIEDILDIDETRVFFQSLKSPCKIIDNRNIKGRHDDVLAIYNF